MLFLEAARMMTLSVTIGRGFLRSHAHLVKLLLFGSHKAVLSMVELRYDCVGRALIGSRRDSISGRSGLVWVGNCDTCLLSGGQFLDEACCRSGA